jgi:hypothetical protein
MRTYAQQIHVQSDTEDCFNMAKHTLSTALVGGCAVPERRQAPRNLYLNPHVIDDTSLAMKSALTAAIEINNCRQSTRRLVPVAREDTAVVKGKSAVSPSTAVFRSHVEM